MATNLLTGAVLADYLPITAQQFGRVLSGAAQGTLALNLRSDISPAMSLVNISAVTPRRSVLWAFINGACAWNGVVWDWNHESAASGMLPLGCQSLESVLAHRLLSETFVFTGTDIFDMMRTLIQYAFGKPYGQVAGITYSSGESGLTDSITFDGTQYQTVADAVATLVQGYGIEYSFRPYQDAAGNLRTNVDLGYPALGLPADQSGLVYTFPGNVLDYAFQATGSTSANSVTATAYSYAETGIPYAGTAQDSADLAAGYPLSELAVSVAGTVWSSDSQLASYAQGYLPQVTDTQLTPLLTLGAESYPQIGQTVIGSWAQFAAASPLHPPRPPGKPGFQGTGRVVAWTAYPPGEGQPSEYVKIQLGDMSAMFRTACECPAGTGD